jgi:hypothetical protein
MTGFGNGAPVGPRFDADPDLDPDPDADPVGAAAAVDGARDNGAREDSVRAGGSWDEDAGYIPDPDAPATPAATIEVMAAELRQLTRASLVATLAVALAFFLFDWSRGAGFENTRGFVVGGLIATANLWMVAGGWFALVERRAEVPRMLLGVGGGFAVLLLVAFYVVFYRRAWTVGFGLGLAVPALGGVLHGMWMTRNQQPREGGGDASVHPSGDATTSSGDDAR